MNKCKKCETEIRWLYHKTTGHVAPIEVQPDLYGNILVKGDKYRLATPEEQKTASENNISLFCNHFATCPAAAEFRGGQK